MVYLARYKGRVYSTCNSISFEDKWADLTSSIPVEASGFKEHIRTVFDKTYVGYRKRVSFDDIDELFCIGLKAIYKGHDDMFCRKMGNQVQLTTGSRAYYTRENKEEHDTFIPLGFKFAAETYYKTVDFEECDEVYELRQDYIIPKGFKKDDTMIHDYNITGVNELGRILSKKVIWKNGVKIGDYHKIQ